MHEQKFLIMTIVGSIVAAAYVLLPYKIVRSSIGYGLRHNDHVMIGIIALVIAVCAAFAWFNKRRDL